MRQSEKPIHTSVSVCGWRQRAETHTDVVINREIAGVAWTGPARGTRGSMWSSSKAVGLLQINSSSGRSAICGLGSSPLPSPPPPNPKAFCNHLFSFLSLLFCSRRIMFTLVFISLLLHNWIRRRSLLRAAPAPPDYSEDGQSDGWRLRGRPLSLLGVYRAIWPRGRGEWEMAAQTSVRSTPRAFFKKRPLIKRDWQPWLFSLKIKCRSLRESLIGCGGGRPDLHLN